MMSSMEGTFLEIPLSEIGESYGRLRLIDPQADARMVDSLRHFGQVFPVVVTERYELIDGFKRVRALRRLGVERVTAKVLEVNVHALKAAMLDLNWIRGSVSDLEEGLVVHSLCREDGLSQVEVAILLGRHKSWVCRRLSLIERLCDEALGHIRLGLIGKSIGRELCRLPRGNQQAALRTILKYRFCCRESARLVSLLLERPRWDWQILLNFPIEILSERVPERPRRRTLTPMAGLLMEKLLDVKQRFLSIADQYAEETLLQLTREEWVPICSTVEVMDKAFHGFKRLIDGIRTRADLGIE
jgi:ParB-like chromosome segregation protein Spo0J